MKQIISGRKYDTESAKLIGSYQNGLKKTDVAYEEEHLYRKRNGEFFIYGIGNEESEYAKELDLFEAVPGSRIVPISEDEALKWASLHLDEKTRNDVFGEAADDEIFIKSISLTGAEVNALKELSSKHPNLSNSRIIGSLIIQAANKEDKIIG